MSGVQVVSIESLNADPKNARRHGTRNADGILASIERFGAARSIVVDAGGVVRAGEGTVNAARRAGIREVLIVDPAPGQLVAVRKHWTEVESTAYAIADNRLTDLSAFAEVDLAEQLRGLQSEDFNLDAIGFESREVDELVEALGSGLIAANPSPRPAAGEIPARPDRPPSPPRPPSSPDDDPPDEFKVYDEAIETMYKCPSCGYRWSGKPA